MKADGGTVGDGAPGPGLQRGGQEPLLPGDGEGAMAVDARDGDGPVGGKEAVDLPPAQAGSERLRAGDQAELRGEESVNLGVHTHTVGANHPDVATTAVPAQD
jgi:hypothetical protein